MHTEDLESYNKSLINSAGPILVASGLAFSGKCVGPVQTKDGELLAAWRDFFCVVSHESIEWYFTTADYFDQIRGPFRSVSLGNIKAITIEPAPKENIDDTENPGGHFSLTVLGLPAPLRMYVESENTRAVWIEQIAMASGNLTPC